MNARSTLERSDYEDYLVYLYFGSEPDLLNCINRAYLDFSRTLHGLSKLASKDKDAPHEPAKNKLEQRFSGLRNDLASVTDAKVFDTWHKDTCQQLSATFAEHGYNKPDRHLFVGQAQKWINMTFKYIFTLDALDEKRLSGFEKVYPFCHAPLDTVLIARLGSKKYSIPWPHQCTWSRLDNYDKYLEYQKQIRRKFRLVPLDVEFRLWLGKDVDTVDAT